MRAVTQRCPLLGGLRTAGGRGVGWAGLGWARLGLRSWPGGRTGPLLTAGHALPPVARLTVG